MKSSTRIIILDQKDRKRSRNAALYFKCKTVDEAAGIEKELRDNAESLRYCVAEVLYDRQDKPPYMLLRMMELMSAGAVNTIIIPSLSSLANDVVSAEAMKLYLNKNGIRVVAITKSERENTLLSILNSIRNYYACGSDWSRSYFLEKASLYENTAIGRVPFGYESVNGCIRIVESDAAIVRKIFELYSNGTPATDIEVQLSREYADKSFSKQQIALIAQNKRYIGIERGVEDGYPAIVSNDLWFRTAAFAKKPKSDADEYCFMFSSVMLDGFGRAYPAYLFCGDRSPIYVFKSGGVEAYIDAAALEDSIVCFIYSRLVANSDSIASACIEYSASRREQAAKACKEAKDELSEYVKEVKALYESCREYPNITNVAKLDERRAALKLLEINMRFREYEAALFGTSEAEIRGFFRRFKLLAALAPAEMKYFIGTFVKNVVFAENKLYISFLGPSPKRTAVTHDIIIHTDGID